MLSIHSLISSLCETKQCKKYVHQCTLVPEFVQSGIRARLAGLTYTGKGIISLCERRKRGVRRKTKVLA